MKRLILLTSLSVIAVRGYSQGSEAVWSQLHPCEKDLFFLGISADHELNTYVMYGNDDKKPDKFALDIFDKNMVFNRTISFALPAGDNSPEYLAARAMEDGFYVFATFQHTTNSSVQKTLFAYTITQNGIESKTELASIPVPDEKQTPHFKMHFSTSGEYYAVLGEHPGVEAESETVTVAVFDKQHKKQYSHQLALDVTFKRNIHNYVFCSNTAHAYLVKKDKEKNVFRYLIYSISAETTSLVGKPLAFAGKHVTDIRATVNEGGQLMVGGFTSSEPMHEYTGYFLASFDAVLNMTFKTSGLLDEYTLNQVLGKKASKDPVLRGFYIDRILNVDDGTTYVFAEEQTHTKTDKKNEHVYGHTLILVYDKEGKYKKSFVLKKQQKTSRTKNDFGSYNCWVKSDSVFIAHNDVTDELIAKGSKLKPPLFLTAHVSLLSYDTGLTTKAWVIDHDAEVPLAFDSEYVYVSQQNEVVVRFITTDATQYRIVRFKPE